MVDTKVYAVTAPNGYRRGGMTLEQARRHAGRLREQMRTAGWAGKVRVFYRDGSEVPDPVDPVGAVGQ